MNGSEVIADESFAVEISKLAIPINCFYRECHILSVLVIYVNFSFYFFSLNSWIKFEERILLEIWTDPNSLQCFAVKITKLAIAMNCFYREWHILSVLVIYVNFSFYFFSLNSWIKFEERILLEIWTDPNSLQRFAVEIAKLGIAMNCSYRRCLILSVLASLVWGILRNCGMAKVTVCRNWWYSVW